jgi:hypothetical protein
MGLLADDLVRAAGRQADDLAAALVRGARRRLGPRLVAVGQRVSVEERGKRDRDVGVGWRACVSKTAVPQGIAAIWFYDPRLASG